MFKFELSEAIVNAILEALAAQPLVKSYDAFNSVRNQFMQQRMAPQQPVGMPAVPPEANGQVLEQ